MPAPKPLVAVVALLFSAATAHSQLVPFAPTTIVARDTGATMQRIADGVYVIIHDRPTNNWPHGNTGVVVGADGVLIIDSNYLPARAVDDIALIRQVTKLPVRYLVNTHWHGDHTHGNGVYRDSFPGIAILGSRQSSHFIALNLTKLPAGALAPESSMRRYLASLETTLARGSDSTGKALTDDEKRQMTVDLGQRRVELREIAKVKVVPPNQIFEGTLTLDLGAGRRVEIRDMGPANSVSDLVVYLPMERVLFAGDILVFPAPYTGGAFFVPWIGVLKQLQSYEVAALVPGHGPALATHDYTRNVHDLFETIRGQLDSLYRLGFQPADAAKRVDVKAMRNRFWTAADGGRPVREAFWDDMIRAVATQMSMCVMGYSC